MEKYTRKEKWMLVGYIALTWLLIIFGIWRLWNGGWFLGILSFAIVAKLIAPVWRNRTKYIRRCRPAPRIKVYDFDDPEHRKELAMMKLDRALARLGLS